MRLNDGKEIKYMIPENEEMRFEVTTRCNYDCSFCKNSKLNRAKEVMSFEVFKQIFDKVISETDQYTSVSFAGLGEPLLDKGLEEKIAYVRTKPFYYDVPIISNGFLLYKERFLSLQKAGVDRIRVSFHGATPEMYSLAHGIPIMAYDIVIKHIDDINTIEDRKTKLLLTHIVLKESNEELTKKWIEQFEPKADMIEVWNLHNWADGYDYREVQKDKLNTCGRVKTGPLQIQVDGTVNLCCFDYDGKLEVGDLKKQSLKEIFTSNPYLKILDCHNSGNFIGSNLICENCDQRNVDNSNACIYSSKFDLKERVKLTSTSYTELKPQK